MSPLLFASLLAFCAAPSQAQLDAQGLNQLFDGTRSIGVTAVPARPMPGSTLSGEKQRLLDNLFAAAPAAARAWPGYNFLDIPFLLSFPDGSAVLVGDASPPAGYHAVDYHGHIVYVSAQGPNIGFDFKRKYDLDGTRVTAIKAVTVAKNSSPITIAVHEHFHDYQKERSFTDSYEPYAVEEGEDVALANEENLALARWLEIGDDEAMRDFSALRRRRRALFPGSAAESFQENIEGTARYVDNAADASIGGASSARDALIRNLRKPQNLEDMRQARLYEVGAALGRFLEARAPGSWQSQTESGRSVSDMALDLLPMDQREIDARIANLTSSADYSRILAEARREVQDFKDRRERARLDFEAQPGLRIHLYGEKGQYFSDDKPWFEYPDGTIIHGHVIEWTGAGPHSRFRVADRVIREQDRSIEFFAASPVSVLIDGRVWSGAAGPVSFHELTLSAPDATIQLQDGFLEYDGRLLSLRLLNPAH